MVAEAGVVTERSVSAPKIFWSWQSDYSPETCRHFIREALISAIELVATELGIDDADRPEVDRDTKGERGMADIAATILNKIANAAVFVADLTPIAQSPAGKWLPNPNVMIELGWAMHRPGWERVIGVLNTASGAEVEDLPFDIRQRRIITFVFSEDADKTTRKRVQAELTRSLKEALSVNLEDRSGQIAAETAVAGTAAKVDNPSIWASAGTTVLHSDSLGRDRRSQVGVPDVPRSYMEVIPSGWKTRPPAIAEVMNLYQTFTIGAPNDSARSGDYGATEEGAVQYWITDWHDDSAYSSANMMMFFEDTGEFWMLHGSAILEFREHRLLKDRVMLGQWSRTLRQTMHVMDDFGARGARRVEAGLFGARDLRWPSEREWDRPISRRNVTTANRQSRDWGADVQMTFLTEAYNRVTNLFALERSTEAEVTEILMQNDRERFALKI